MWRVATSRQLGILLCSLAVLYEPLNVLTCLSLFRYLVNYYISRVKASEYDEVNQHP